MRRVDLLALAIELARVFLLSRQPPAPLLGRLNLFLYARSDLLGSGGSGFCLLGVGLALGCRFPLTHPSAHQGRAVGLSHITALDKQVDDRDIPSIVIQLKLLALQSIE